LARIVRGFVDMKIVALERKVPGVPDDACHPHLRAESESAVLVLECAGADEARRALETLPLVERGLDRIRPDPPESLPGFGRLFVGGD
jgi:hypothetical protein